MHPGERSLVRKEAGETRCQILEVALQLFRAQGYDKTTLRQIAKQLGMTQAALYYWFKAKDDLLTALAVSLLDNIDELLEECSADDARDLSQRELLARYLNVVRCQSAVADFLANDRAALTHQAIQPRVHQQNERLRSLLTGQDPSLAEMVQARAALGALQICLFSIPEEQFGGLEEIVLDAALAPLRQAKGEKNMTEDRLGKSVHAAKNVSGDARFGAISCE